MELKIETTRTPRPKPDMTQLGFGQYFSDHMFCVNYAEKKGWFDARVIPYQPLALDPAACVLHYGQALFEGSKAFLGKDGKARLFRPDYHCARLASGAKRLCMPAPPAELMKQGIQALTKIDHDWIPKTPGASLYLRPTLIGTEGFLGVRPSNEYLFFIIASPVGNYYAEGLNPVKIWVEDQYVRASVGGIGSVKAAANYAASLYAAMEAKKRGYAQVLWLDAQEKKYIEEVGTMNVFFKIGDQVITPTLDSGTLLAGATRLSTLELLKSWGTPAIERRISIDEVLEARKKGTLVEAFGTGTAAVIAPIGELFYKGTAHSIGDGTRGELAQRLYDTITGIQYAKLPDTLGWMQETA